MQRSTGLLAQLADAVTFLSRVPMPRPPGVPAGQAGADFLRFAPLAGVVVASLGSTALAFARLAGLPNPAGAALAVAGMILATGALHEDGLADVADGFGGGRTRESKLAIMRDSRIGTFGAAALGLALILRVTCLSAILDRGGLPLAVAALIIAAAFSRAAMLVPLRWLAPARADGLARTVGTLRIAPFCVASILAVGIGGLACCAAPPLWPRLLPTAGLAGISAALMAWLARRQIAGVTGDVIGATQQVAEITVLLSLSASAFG